MSSTHSRTAAALIVGSIMLLILVAITYRAAPENGFHLDDSRNIFRYPPVMVTELSIANVIAAGRDAFIPTRPLPSMTFAIDWARGGGSARPFQQTNIAIHGVTAVAVFGLLFLLLRRLALSPGICVTASFFGAALWACHPIQVQAVTYIVQRMTSMAALFTILTVILYILGRQTSVTWRRWLFYGLAMTCWISGLASKETAAIAPFLILLVEYGLLRHGEDIVRNRLDIVLLLLPVALALLVVIDIASGIGPLSQAFLPGYERRDFTLAERLLTQPRVIAMHLSQFIWPLPSRFSLEHDVATSVSLFEPPATLFALLGLIAWCGVGIWLFLRRRSRIAGVLFLWMPATLVIESSIVPLEMVFEHRMYLPSVALAGFAGLAIGWVLQNRARWVFSVAGLCAAVVITLILSTGRYVPVWKDMLSLARHSVEVAPSSARSWAALAGVLHGQGKGWEHVLPPMQRALELNPNQGTALNLRALRFIELGKFEEAERIVDGLQQIAAVDHSVVNTSGMLRLAQGDPAAAAREFESVTALNPYEPVFQYNLALSYELSGQCAKALDAWLKFVTMDTDQRHIDAVRQRLRQNFEAEGGRCSGSVGQAVLDGSFKR